MTPEPYVPREYGVRSAPARASEDPRPPRPLRARTAVRISARSRSPRSTRAAAEGVEEIEESVCGLVRLDNVRAVGVGQFDGRAKRRIGIRRQDTGDGLGEIGRREGEHVTGSIADRPRPSDVERESKGGPLRPECLFRPRVEPSFSRS